MKVLDPRTSVVRSAPAAVREAVAQNPFNDAEFNAQDWSELEIHPARPRAAGDVSGKILSIGGKLVRAERMYDAQGNQIHQYASRTRRYED